MKRRLFFILSAIIALIVYMGVNLMGISLLSAYMGKQVKKCMKKNSSVNILNLLKTSCNQDKPHFK